jgi:hypothetical protein
MTSVSVTAIGVGRPVAVALAGGSGDTGDGDAAIAGVMLAAAGVVGSGLLPLQPIAAMSIDTKKAATNAARLARRR